MTVENKILLIVASQLDMSMDEIDLDDHLVDDLGADSLDLAEMISELEEEFDIDIPDEDAQTLTTVKAAIDYIEE